MALFGNKGLIRQQEVAFARKLLAVKYEQAGREVPDRDTLTAQARDIVDEAHCIAKRGGTNLMAIIRETLNRRT